MPEEWPNRLCSWTRTVGPFGLVFSAFQKLYTRLCHDQKVLVFCRSPCFIPCFFRDKTEMSYQWSNWQPVGFFLSPYLSLAISRSFSIFDPVWQICNKFSTVLSKVELLVTGHHAICIVQKRKNAVIPESNVLFVLH